jgi:hypothetical protein
MAFSQKKKDKSEPIKDTCECNCWNCDIGAHERCNSPLCKMPKWNEIPRKR